MLNYLDILLELTKFNAITFNEADHSYFYDGERCTSVTSLIAKFKKPFETEKRAKSYAKKHGLLVEDVITNWDLSGKEASHKGSEVHKYAEYKFFNKHYNVDIFSGALPLCRQVDQFYEDTKEYLIPIRAELVVGDINLLLCGMIDKLFYNLRTGMIEIWDYKTNKKIRRRSEYGNRMINGLSHLAECEFNTYSLQLTIYKKIIEKNTSLRLGNSYVCWLNEGNTSYEIIKMDYMERESDIIFNSIAA
jgi:ATP-dependent exoDNAse (exonuclease V) beta subunit